MGRIKQSQITYWCHEIIRSQAEAGGCYIDATMGKGNDTLFLCELAGENGKVLAFDIQQEALDATRELLRTHGKEQQAELEAQITAKTDLRGFYGAAPAMNRARDQIKGLVCGIRG